MSSSEDVMLVRAKQLLASARHIALATVNEDGTPHNVPLFAIISPKLQQVYWVSEAEALHSQNIERTGRGFFTLFNQDEACGVYFQCVDGRRANTAEAAEALDLQNDRRARLGKEQLPDDFYSDRPHLITYVADVEKLWIYDSQKDPDGRTIKDIRRAVTAKELL